MELLVYEELYQTPFKFDFEPPYCGKVNCEKPQNCNGNHDFNGATSYFLKNHQNRTVIDKVTKVSQQGLEMRAQHQEAKRIRTNNEGLIVGILKVPIQSKRSRRHRNKRKYCNYLTGAY